MFLLKHGKLSQNTHNIFSIDSELSFMCITLRKKKFQTGEDTLTRALYLMKYFENWNVYQKDFKWAHNTCTCVVMMLMMMLVWWVTVTSLTSAFLTFTSAQNNASPCEIIFSAYYMSDTNSAKMNLTCEISLPNIICFPLQ